MNLHTVDARELMQSANRVKSSAKGITDAAKRVGGRLERMKRQMRGLRTMEIGGGFVRSVAGMVQSITDFERRVIG